MPKENLNSVAEQASVLDPDGSTHLVNVEFYDPQVTLHWSGADAVQFGVEIDVRKLRQLQADIDNPGTRSLNLYTGALSRSEINRAIRALRRSRDAVFGSDE